MSTSLLSRINDQWLEWQSLGLRVTVTLTGAVALLSVLTGIANIGAQSVTGPLEHFIPPMVQRTAGFTGALTGFLMIGSAYGLRRRLRIAWYSTLILLPVTALQGVLQLNPLSVPLILVSALAMPNVLYQRQHFNRNLELTTAQLAAALAIIGAQVYGTVGAYALRGEFTNVSTPVDAFYYTLVTASTVGYGDITATSQVARLFSMSVVIIGTASFALAVGTLLGPIVQARLSRALGRMTEIDLDLLDNHILIIGQGDILLALINEIQDREDVLVVSPEHEDIQELSNKEIKAFTADPENEESLTQAGVERARAVIVASNDDAEDAMTILTARQLNPAVNIFAVATNRENIRKLERAGANSVISPAVMAAQQLFNSALNEDELPG